MTHSILHVLSLVLHATVACGEPTFVPDEEQLAHRAPPITGEVQALEVVALANEGFLLRSGEQSVLIDAFLAMGYAGADALPEPVLAKLSAAEPPFDGVDLALISHQHADHVQGRPARAFLAASPDTLLASSPQALAIVLGIIPGDETADFTGDDLREAMRESMKDGDPDPIALEVHLPEPGRSSFVERNSVHVEFLRLSHGPRFPDVQNLGHIITLGGHHHVRMALRQRLGHLRPLPRRDVAGDDQARPQVLVDQTAAVGLEEVPVGHERHVERAVGEGVRPEVSRVGARVA
jgi:hypothetical protein